MNIIWDMSNKCNLECRHCGAWNLMKNSENLTRKQMTDIANNMTAIADSVSLLGGEPLLAIGIDEVCDIFMENGVAIDLITNGQIYNQSIENLLRKKNVQNIYVSIDGLENDNDEIRGYGSWKKSINFLHRILEFKSASKKVGVTMVLTKTSIRQLEKFMEYFNEFDIDVISFNLLDISGNAVTYKEELFLDDSTILKTLEVIASMQDDLNYQIVINSGSSTVDRYLRNKTGYVQENAQYECDALYGSAYCDMNGFFYPCRSYQGKGIDLKRKVNWEKEYAIFNDFLQKLFCSAEAVCPLKKRKDSSLDILAEKKLTELSVPDYQINQTIIFNKVDDRYFIIFCKTNEYVEYTQEGFMIYHLLSNNMSTCSIASQLQYTVEDVWNFLDSELIKKRIAYHRKEKELNRDKIV